MKLADLVKFSVPDLVRRKLYPGILRSIMDVEPWCLDSVVVGEDTIEIRGWAIPPKGDHTRVGFMINDYEFDQVHYPRQREDIKRLFWYAPGAEATGFSCRLNISGQRAFPNSYATLKYVNKDTMEPLRSRHNYYYYDPDLNDQVPIPEGDRRIRVHGSDSEEAFLLEGYTTYKKLEVALEETMGKRYDDFSRILDWGCGCGRVARYFGGMQESIFVGVDIDADNINWCKQNLAFGHFLDIPLHPPTDLKAGAYDLLIGISIFTHLREETQFEWLDELRRVASDGAILLMTVHSNATVCRTNLDPGLFADWRKTGFLDAGMNFDLDGIMEDDSDYRNTFHTREYVLENWSRYFEIVRIIPGYVGNHQDLVIMVVKKR